MSAELRSDRTRPRSSSVSAILEIEDEFPSENEEDPRNAEFANDRRDGSEFRELIDDR